jgi:hypothetical protein
MRTSSSRARRARSGRVLSPPTSSTRRPVPPGSRTPTRSSTAAWSSRNGYIGDLEKLESELGDYRRIVKGGSDSERLFALIVKEIDAAGGDVEADVAAAVGWLAHSLPLFAANLVLSSPADVWGAALPGESRAPDPRALARRPERGPPPRRDEPGRNRAGPSRALGGQPAVILASEQMDGSLLARARRRRDGPDVGPGLDVVSGMVLDEPPAHPPCLEELEPKAAASQRTVRELRAGI